MIIKLLSISFTSTLWKHIPQSSNLLEVVMHDKLMLINILMLYVRIHLERLMCSLGYEMSLIVKKGKLYIIPSFLQISIIVQLPGISATKLQNMNI